MPKHKLGKLETGGSATQQSSGIKVMAYLIFQGFSNMKKKKKRNVDEKHGTENLGVTLEVTKQK